MQLLYACNIIYHIGGNILCVCACTCMYSVHAEISSTTAISGPTVTVLEGDSVDISCTSTGVPTPSITWSFNNTAAPFEQTDTVVDVKATILAPGQFTVDPGTITSELHIVSASYPDHDGVYTCVGVNSEDAVFTSSSAFITVQVQGTG